MRVFTDVKILFCFIYIEYSWDKYPQKLNNFDVKASCKNKIVFTTGFFLCRKMSVFRCRSPPYPINLKNLD
jgi:hypothetical protein